MPGFLELLLSTKVCLCVCVFACVYVCVCVCPPPRLLITSGVMWCVVDPYDWLNKFYGLHMAAVISIDSRHDVSIHTRHRN